MGTSKEGEGGAFKERILILHHDGERPDYFLHEREHSASLYVMSRNGVTVNVIASQKGRPLPRVVKDDAGTGSGSRQVTVQEYISRPREGFPSREAPQAQTPQPTDSAAKEGLNTWPPDDDVKVLEEHGFRHSPLSSARKQRDTAGTKASPASPPGREESPSRSSRSSRTPRPTLTRPKGGSTTR